MPGTRRPATRHAAAAALAGCLLLAWGTARAADAPGPRSAASVPAPAIVTPAGFRNAVAAERGKVLVVNLWASWCAPCLREVPDLLRLEQAYGRCGLRVLGLALDEPAELSSTVIPTLARYFPGFRTLARDASSMDSFASVLDDAWNEVMPTSYVVAADGRVARRIQGGKSYAEFETAVTPLLNCPPG